MDLQTNANEHIIHAGAAAFPAVGSLNLPALETQARLFGADLAAHGFAHMVLDELNDGTRYEVMACRRVSVLGGAPYVFGSNLGPLYQWNGRPSIHPEYAAEKWCERGSPWTGTVYALLLNWAAEAL